MFKEEYNRRDSMYKNETVERMMKEKGQCLPLTKPGAYTIIYLNTTDNILCSVCATEQAKDITTVRTYNEGPVIHCEECNAELEASYGNLDGEVN